MLYDGPTRGICPLFPRNVNSHAAVALAGIGFDRTRSLFIADPGLDRSSIHLQARGQGVEMSLTRSSPMTGVSSQVVLNSIRSSIVKVQRSRRQPANLLIAMPVPARPSRESGARPEVPAAPAIRRN